VGFYHHFLRDPIEQPDPAYSGRHEVRFLVISLLALLFRQVLLISADYRTNTGTPVYEAGAPILGDMVYVAAWQALTYVSVVALATKPGEAYVRRWLQRRPEVLAVIAPAAILIYVVGGVGLGLYSVVAEAGRLADSFAPGSWVLNLGLGLGAVYLMTATSILFAQAKADQRGLLQQFQGGWRDPSTKSRLGHLVALMAYSPLIGRALGLGWWSLATPLVVFLGYWLSQQPCFKENPQFNTSDLLVAALGAGLLATVQEVVPLVWCFTLPLVVICVMLASGLGREHFYYSFVPRSGKEVIELMDLVAFSILFFIPFAWLVGFINPLVTWDPTPTGAELLLNITTWVYLVGIGEELIFRCGLLILIADGLRHIGGLLEDPAKVSRKRGLRVVAALGLTPLLKKLAAQPMVTALLVSSIIFGLAHLPNGGGYALCAIVAGVAYGLAFTKSKGLFGAVLLHAIVDVIAVSYFGAAL
jgi:hypothetical protein